MWERKAQTPDTERRAELLIDVQRMSKIYNEGRENEVRALDDISLQVSWGEFLCILGQSGSGKSTLMNILGCLDIPTYGSYHLNGQPVSDMKPSVLSGIRNREIGFIFQGFNLIPALTALENVELPLIYRGMPREERRRLAQEALVSVGLEKRMDHRPGEMSGGQQQRVGIARAFVAKPKVIFADEPTGNLDSTTSRQVLYSMLEMAKSYGITFVMVTHEKELAYCGDRIVTIKDGRVLDNVLLGEDEKAENRRRLFGDVTSGDIAEPETTVEEEKKPAAKQAKAVAAAVAEKVNQESM